jgi:endo-1,4-beta-xylanase
VKTAVSEQQILSDCGEDFIKLAFHLPTKPTLMPNCITTITTSGTPASAIAIVQMIRKLKAEGVRIDGIGMQRMSVWMARDNRL